MAGVACGLPDKFFTAENAELRRVDAMSDWHPLHTASSAKLCVLCGESTCPTTRSAPTLDTALYSSRRAP